MQPGTDPDWFIDGPLAEFNEHMQASLRPSHLGCMDETTSSMATARYLADHLGSAEPASADPLPTDYSRSDDINLIPRPSLSFCNLR